MMYQDSADFELGVKKTSPSKLRYCELKANADVSGKLFKRLWVDNKLISASKNTDVGKTVGQVNVIA